MSQPSAKPPPSRDQEAVPYATVRFQFTAPDGKSRTIEGDCLMKATIDGLKQEYAIKFGPANKQNWYYRGVLMSNTDTLENYEIDCKEDIDIEVRSSRK